MSSGRCRYQMCFCGQSDLLRDQHLLVKLPNTMMWYDDVAHCDWLYVLYFLLKWTYHSITINCKNPKSRMIQKDKLHGTLTHNMLSMAASLHHLHIDWWITINRCFCLYLTFTLAIYTSLFHANKALFNLSILTVLVSSGIVLTRTVVQLQNPSNLLQRKS